MTAAEYDPRVTPARPDLAADRLEGLVSAARFVPGERFVVIAPSLALRATPDEAGEQWNQMLAGEIVTVYERRGDWAWGQAARDHYVGWMRIAAIARESETPAANAWVTAPRTFAFSRPDLKSRPVALLSKNARLHVAAVDGKFRHADGFGWIYGDHIAPLARQNDDPIAAALDYLGGVYQWGGVENIGLDCSGLVQMAFLSAGLRVPRDTDMQRRALGETVDLDGLDLDGPALDERALDARLERGDLLFWRGHVAFALGEGTILHANAFHMGVRREPLAGALTRIAASAGPLLTVKRVGRAAIAAGGEVRPPGAL